MTRLCTAAMAPSLDPTRRSSTGNCGLRGGAAGALVCPAAFARNRAEVPGTRPATLSAELRHCSQSCVSPHKALPIGERFAMRGLSEAFLAESRPPARDSCAARGLSPPDWASSSHKHVVLAKILQPSPERTQRWLHWVVSICSEHPAARKRGVMLPQSTRQLRLKSVAPRMMARVRAN